MTKIKAQKTIHSYQNAMELLIEEEIERQFAQFPANLTRYINQLEVATYALNRLPPLYASSQEGLERQKERGKKEFNSQIVTAVRQGFAAVQRDPLRFSTPLIPTKELEYQKAQIALQEIADLLPYGKISWTTLTKIVRRLVIAQTNAEKAKETLQGEIPYSPKSLDWNDPRYCR